MDGVGDPPKKLRALPATKGRDGDLIDIQLLTCQAVTSYPWTDGEPEIAETISVQRYLVTVADKVVTHAVRYGGVSMQPTILNGSLVGIDLDNRHIVDSAMFAVQFSEGGYPVVRRLKPKVGGCLFAADNPATEDQLIAREQMESGEIRILGRVRWILNKF
ncbi:MAG: hypothetical protein OXK19_01570 [Candidatus Dadabacteria bacterium]|nr:hypothetical protein [Candidatus Dadabacteria bacterium]